MRSAADFPVFDRWREAPAYAFGSRSKPSIVTSDDKAAYARIFDELLAAATRARDLIGGGELDVKRMGFSPEYGSRGHRPVDLWVSVCGSDSRPLAQMPQVYAIASHRGLEVGFAASIDEADYHDAEVKARNRLVIPLLNAKLPAANDPLTVRLEETLAAQGGWRFNGKTRLMAEDAGWDAYAGLGGMLSALRASGAATGGGAACRVYSYAELADLDLDAEFEAAVLMFLPLIERCGPTAWDVRVVRDLDAVSDLVEEVAFDPTGIVDARRLVLAAVARRQGQAAFRAALMKAYGGRCAVTGTAVSSVLQAAHITPYLGAQTNHVTNGLLLRADIHTLFDLGLIRVEPETLKVRVSEALAGTPYERYEGRPLAPTDSSAQRPSAAALQAQFDGPAGVAEKGP